MYFTRLRVVMFVYDFNNCGRFIFIYRYIDLIFINVEPIWEFSLICVYSYMKGRHIG